MWAITYDECGGCVSKTMKSTLRDWIRERLSCSPSACGSPTQKSFIVPVIRVSVDQIGDILV